MALFVLASKDGWVNIMYTGLDAVGVDMQVVRLMCFMFLYSINVIYMQGGPKKHQYALRSVVCW